ncbi:MAG: rhomboid family intramembrane serine protease [Clostridium sp.]|nr:rhomboid family intramembrane serine protease [Clostridium sp.]
MNIKINKKDDIMLKILHYFITEEDYKPVIINGLDNEIWLENMENDLKLIRINTNYIHNEEQFKSDIFKVKTIMKSIKRNTLSFKMTTLNLLLDTGDNVSIIDNKNIETIKIDGLDDFKKNKFVKEFFPKIKETDFNDKVDPVEFFKLTEDMNQNTMKKEKKLEKIFSPKKPVVTYILIVLNLMVFLYGVLHGNDELINMFGNNYELVQNGEFYRLFTCMFVHADILHILFNMIALYSIGPVVERYYGKSKFLLIYLVSGLLGSIFSGVFMTADSISIGASGAIFGLLGSISYFTYYYRATLQGILRGSIMPVIIINLVIGFLSSSIDLSAHIGGLIGGILISMAIGIGDKHRKSDQINGLVVLVLMAAFLIYMMMTK